MASLMIAEGSWRKWADPQDVRGIPFQVFTTMLSIVAGFGAKKLVGKVGGNLSPMAKMIAPLAATALSAAAFQVGSQCVVRGGLEVVDPVEAAKADAAAKGKKPDGEKKPQGDDEAGNEGADAGAKKGYCA